MGGLWFGQQHVEYLVAIEIAAATENSFIAVIVNTAAEHELACFTIDAPAGEGARSLLDVALAVMALADGKKLHHLAREIFVRLVFAAIGTIEVNQHRRVAGHFVQQCAEVAQSMPTQQNILLIDQGRKPHFLLAGRKMVVPEQGHFFGERRCGDEHFAEPPLAQFKTMFEIAAQLRHALFLRHLLAFGRWQRRLINPCRWRRGRN